MRAPSARPRATQRRCRRRRGRAPLAPSAARTPYPASEWPPRPAAGVGPRPRGPPGRRTSRWRARAGRDGRRRRAGERRQRGCDARPVRGPSTMLGRPPATAASRAGRDRRPAQRGDRHVKRPAAARAPPRLLELHGDAFVRFSPASGSIRHGVELTDNAGRAGVGREPYADLCVKVRADDRYFSLATGSQAACATSR